ncbi:MAG: enoyl-CoA hydratase-related protein [Myxococcota bacterium]
MSELVQVTDEGAVRTLTLNRPEKKNAFNAALATALMDALRDADESDKVHVVVVTANGSVFSGGADVSLFLAVAQGKFEDGKTVSALPWALRAVRKPLLAAIQGPAVGMGVTMLPHFDTVYAAKRATFGVPFVQLGLVQEFGSSWTLPRLIGRQRAAELILRARPIDAETAQAWGLVTRVFDSAALLDEVHAIAKDMATAPLDALVHAKALLRQGEAGTIDEARQAEDEVLEARYGSPTNIAAVQAFFARQKKKKS